MTRTPDTLKQNFISFTHRKHHRRVADGTALESKNVGTEDRLNYKQLLPELPLRLYAQRRTHEKSFPFRPYCYKTSKTEYPAMKIWHFFTHPSGQGLETKALTETLTCPALILFNDVIIQGGSNMTGTICV
jgi:hypothetical protein